MLVEVQCNKFISDGKPRGPITFHSGLNVVLGNDNGSNSIGKSTFLMILDFVFGGKDYVERCADVQREVGEQLICFTFQFDGESFSFSRNTINPGYVNICDANYNIKVGTKPITIQEYGNFLCQKYGIYPDGLTWRGAVSRFIRVYKRDTLDEERPLKSSNGEGVQQTIKQYMKLFDRYSPVEAQIKAAADAKDEADAFRKSSQTYNHIPAAKDDKEKEANEKRIVSLKAEIEKLAEQNDRGILNLDSITVARVSTLNEKLSLINRELASTQAKLSSVNASIAGEKKGFKRSFAELERFFPNEEFKSLSEIESFHKKLTKVLDYEFQDAKTNLEDTSEFLRAEIAELESELAEIKDVPNVPEATMKEYSRLDGELTRLIEANKNFDELQRLKDQVEITENAKNAVIVEELQAIEETINPQMKVITYEVLDDETHLPPILHLESLSKYSFSTPNDGGTGAQHRALITFDLANLVTTPLPFVVHDSVLMKNIEKPVLSRIFKRYTSEAATGKQVFIAYDSLSSYDEATQKILIENQVLELSPNGNELFGWAWNKDEDQGSNNE